MMQQSVKRSHVQHGYSNGILSAVEAFPEDQSFTFSTISDKLRMEAVLGPRNITSVASKSEEDTNKRGSRLDDDTKLQSISERDRFKKGAEKERKIKIRWERLKVLMACTAGLGALSCRPRAEREFHDREEYIAAGSDTTDSSSVSYGTEQEAKFKGKTEDAQEGYLYPVPRSGVAMQARHGDPPVATIEVKNHKVPPTRNETQQNQDLGMLDMATCGACAAIPGILESLELTQWLYGAGPDADSDMSGPQKESLQLKNHALVDNLVRTVENNGTNRKYTEKSDLISLAPKKMYRYSDDMVSLEFSGSNVFIHTRTGKRASRALKLAICDERGNLYKWRKKLDTSESSQPGGPSHSAIPADNSVKKGDCSFTLRFFKSEVSMSSKTGTKSSCAVEVVALSDKGKLYHWQKYGYAPSVETVPMSKSILLPSKVTSKTAAEFEHRLSRNSTKGSLHAVVREGEINLAHGRPKARRHFFMK